MASILVRETRSYFFILWMACCLLGTACVAEGQELPQPAAQQAAAKTPSDDRFAGVRARIQRDMKQGEIPGFAIAVARNGEILWEEGFGWADLEKRIPATPNTSFGLASVSKPITATGLMVLVQQGKIDLDAPVNRYLPKDAQLKVWIGDPNEVTVRRVANHTAGLPRHEHFFRGSRASLKPPMAESIRRYGNIVRPPGERYRYSNFGYGILDYVIECVSGESFGDFMRTEVFMPLDMTHSSVGIDPGLEEFTPARYDNNRALRFETTDHAGASEICASTHDLVRFGMFHIGQIGSNQKAVLSKESRAAMQVPTARIAPVDPAGTQMVAGAHYGIGWVIDDDALGRRLSHTGGMGGISSRILLMPDEGIVVASAANQFCGLPELIERDVLTVLLPDYAERTAKYRQAHRGAGRGNAAQLYTPTPELLGEWKGRVHTYAGSFPVDLSFKASGEILARIDGRESTPLSDVEFVNNRLMGTVRVGFDSRQGNRGSKRYFRRLTLDLTLRGDVLNGVLIGVTDGAIGQWIELSKVKIIPAVGATTSSDQKSEFKE